MPCYEMIIVILLIGLTLSETAPIADNETEQEHADVLERLIERSEALKRMNDQLMGHLNPADLHDLTDAQKRRLEVWDPVNRMLETCFFPEDKTFAESRIMGLAYSVLTKLNTENRPMLRAMISYLAKNYKKATTAWYNYNGIEQIFAEDELVRAIEGLIDITYQIEFHTLEEQLKVRTVDNETNWYRFYEEAANFTFEYKHWELTCDNDNPATWSIRPYFWMHNETRFYPSPINPIDAMPTKRHRRATSWLNEQKPTADMKDLVLAPRPGSDSPETAEDADRIFQAYDCSSPIDKKTVRPPPKVDCERGRGEVMAVMKTQYTLMQSVPHYRINVTSCTLKRHVMPMYCGVYDHQTVNTQDMEWNKPIKLNAADCRAYIQTRRYSVILQVSDSNVKTTEWDILLNQNNRFKYNSHGITTLREKEVSCVGANYYSPSKEATLSRTVRWVQDELLLFEDEILVQPDGTMQTHKKQRTLPAHCFPGNGFCKGEDETWVWNVPTSEDQCRLFAVRAQIEGEEYIAQTGTGLKTVFVDNQKLIRLHKGQSVHQCNKMVYKTNYQNLYLFDNRHDDWGQKRPIPEADLSMNTYMNMKQEYVKETIEEEVDRLVRDLMERWCKEEQLNDARQYGELAARVHARGEGETVHLEGSRFATAAGEAWYTYLCKPLSVIAIDTDKCYDAMPVKLYAADRTVMDAMEMQRRKAVGAEGTDYVPPQQMQYYMEPITRRLTTVAKEVPCTQYLPAVYENKKGNWMQTTPILMNAQTPEILGKDEVERIHFNRTQHGIFEEGGIYSLEALQKFEQYQMMPRVTAAAVAEIT